MEYQVKWNVLQAGHFGVPQSRQRIFIIAAHKGYDLPKIPEKQFAFYEKYQDKEKFLYRKITVRNAISDLPLIKDGASQEIMKHRIDPMTPFQKISRSSNNLLLKDHIANKMDRKSNIIARNLLPESNWTQLDEYVKKWPIENLQLK